MSERHMVRWPDHWAPQSLLVEVFNVPLHSAEAAPLLAGMQGEGQIVKVCVTVYMCAARLCIILAQSAFVHSDRAMFGFLRIARPATIQQASSL